MVLLRSLQVRGSNMDRLVLLSEGKHAWEARMILLEQAQTEIQMACAYVYLDSYGNWVLWHSLQIYRVVRTAVVPHGMPKHTL